MTYEEALDRLDKTFIGDLELKVILTEALQKQIKQKPKGDYHSCPHYRCPNCHRSVKMYQGDKVYPHCGFCGQALNWR